LLTVALPSLAYLSRPHLELSCYAYLSTFCNCLEFCSDKWYLSVTEIRERQEA